RSRPARGTILKYGVHGVCHQVANQALYATRTQPAPPATVSGAKGYWASTFLYFTYGRKEKAWLKSISSCGPNSGEFQMRDEFEERAKALRKDEAELLERLLALRNKSRNQSTKGNPSQVSKNLNAQNQALLHQAAALLGPVRFKKLFGFAA